MEVASQQYFDYHGDIKCPICAERLTIKVLAKVKPGYARSTSSDGLGRSFLSLDIDVKPIKVYITHECEVNQDD